LKDFQKTAHLSPSDRLFQGIGNNFMKGKFDSDHPLWSHNPQSGVIDKISSPQVQKRMAENKLEPIGDYLMAWNRVRVFSFMEDHLILTCVAPQYFFHPRRMSVVLAMGNHRFSGETDDYPPDLRRGSKKASKEKKSSQYKTRSTDAPLVRAAEPYPRGSLLGGLLNPIHKTLNDVAMAPHQVLLGTQPRGVPGQRGRGRSDPEDSDSSSSSSSSSSESDDRRRGHGRNFGAGRGRLLEDRMAILGNRRGDRRGDRRARKEERREDRRARREDRKEDRKSKHGKGKDSAATPEFPSTRFRLVVCYWDGQEVYY
jgi:hypothetical protein